MQGFALPQNHFAALPKVVAAVQNDRQTLQIGIIS